MITKALSLINFFHLPPCPLYFLGHTNLEVSDESSGTAIYDSDKERQEKPLLAKIPKGYRYSEQHENIL